MRNIFRVLFFPAIVVFLLLAVFFLPGRLIKINTIKCVSQYGSCPEELVKNTQNIVSNLNLTKKLIRKVLDDNQLVSAYSFQYEFPDRLNVNIITRKARYAILNKDTGKYYLIDTEGKILSEVQLTSLPTVIQSGQSPNLLALSLIEGIYALYQISQGEIVGDSLVVELPTHVRVIFPLDGSKSNEVLLGSLRLIYSQVTDKEIDLRFKNALLR